MLDTNGFTDMLPLINSEQHQSLEISHDKRHPLPSSRGDADEQGNIHTAPLKLACKLDRMKPALTIPENHELPPLAMECLQFI